MESDFWTAAVIISSLAIVSGIVSQWIRARYRYRRKEFDARLSALEKQTDLEQLDERVRVLESIVTDHRGNLKQKIDSL